MRQDVASLMAFYASPLGQLAAQSLTERIATLWPDVASTTLLSVGYAPPLLDMLPSAPARRVCAMPAGQGATTWMASERGVATCLTDETHLPFADEVFDRAIVIHGLEETSAPQPLMRDVWRVLAPEGRVLVIVANRLGLWCRSERTPFGHGRPWTRLQLTRLLSNSAFQTTAWTYGLHMPPLNWGPILTLAEVWERAGETLTRNMGGVVMVEAVKRLYIEPNNGGLRPLTRIVSQAPKGAARAPKD